MKNALLLSLFAILFFSSCGKSQKNADLAGSSNSFMPLQIGNLWKIDAQNFTEIQDTLRINKDLYFKFHSLIGGDGVSTQYLRLDENNQLLESYPNDPDKKYLHAKFNANLNDEFYTLGDKSVNDYKVKVLLKNDEKMTFEYDMVYHPNLKGHPHQVTYIKGIGYPGEWNQLKINGVVIK